MQPTSNAPHTIDSLLRVVEPRDAEVALLKLMVDKFKVQLLRRVRAQFGPSSEQLDDPQIALIEGVTTRLTISRARGPNRWSGWSEPRCITCHRSR